MAAREEFEPLIESDHSSSGGDDDAPIYVPVGGSSAPLSPRQPGTPLELYDPDQPHTHHLNREIRKAIKSVRAPPSSSSSGSVPGIEAKNGQLLKKKRKSNSWAKVTAQLDPSTGTITYSKNSSVWLPFSFLSFPFLLLLTTRERSFLSSQRSAPRLHCCWSKSWRTRFRTSSTRRARRWPNCALLSGRNDDRFSSAVTRTKSSWNGTEPSKRFSTTSSLPQSSIRRPPPPRSVLFWLWH